MTSQGNQVPLAPGPRGPGPYSRASTPHRVECYHSSGATGAGYMSNTPAGAQTSTQALRVQPTQQQQTVTTSSQKDLAKTTMASHSFVAPQNQTAQTRPQYPSYQYRAQHGTRPNSHPRPQQSFIAGGPTTPSGPVMYPTLLYTPQMFNQQSYQQPRSQGFPIYMTPYYSSPGHNTPYYYPPNNQQLSTNLQANTTSSRNTQTPLTGPQGTTPTPTNNATTLPHPQAQTHIHQPIAGIRQPPVKRSHRVRIINPETQKEITLDDSQSLSGESSERQTPQPDPAAHSIVEEFNRMVNEAAQQPTASEIKSSFVSKKAEYSTSILQPQTNAITNISNLAKSDLLIVNENKNIGPDIAVESNETPVVSAMSDSPVIVPKISKQFQKPCEQQPLVIDTNKNVQSKQQKKSKPVVPQVDDVEMPADYDDPVVPPVASVATTSDVNNEVWVAPASVPPMIQPAIESVPLASSVASTASQPVTVYVAEPRPVLPPTPQPQRIREPRERHKSEDKATLENKGNDADMTDSDNQPLSLEPNGPVIPVVISSVDSSPEVISSSTSQSSPQIDESIKLDSGKTDNITVEPLKEAAAPIPTPTELLSASIDKLANLELPTPVEILPESKEASSAIQAQAKLTQSIASCLRTNQPQAKMKDINLNNKTIDPETANGNSEVDNSETAEEDINKNEKVVNKTKSTKNTNKKSLNKMASIESTTKDSESYENSKSETDKISIEEENSVEKDETLDKEINEDDTTEPPQQVVFVPKYKYRNDQWSPLNKSGKKCYDIGLLKQIKDDPLSKNKPNVPLLETWNIFRSAPLPEPMSFSPMSRSVNDTIMPSFLKNTGANSRNNPSRDIKKDGRNMTLGGKGSIKCPQTPTGSSRDNKPIIHVSLSLRDDVKLNQAENAWKPSWALKKETADEAEFKTQDLYKKFRGILNKLTPQKFETLMERVQKLDINNRKRLEGVIDLVFEKAIEEPNFSEAYAAMCNKLSMLKVPADNATAPDQYVNFRALIISKCQNQFQTNKVDEQVSKLEKEMLECTDPAKKKELQLQITDENRKVRMRSVGNVRFIGELYKLKMLTPKIMGYCMTHLVDKIEEEKLECLCKLLTTIGQQVESELKTQLDDVFRKMRDIVDHKSNKISSRVRFMIQDVIALRKRRWTLKSVVDSQPKTMDQIQKEAEEHQRHIEIVNSSPGSGFRREEGNRGKRGDSRRQSSNTYMDNNYQWKSPKNPVDMSKLKAVSQNAKNVSNTKLAPQNSWNFGLAAKNVQASSNSMINVSKNKFSALDTVSTEPPFLRGNKDVNPPYPKGASIERSSFAQRSHYSGGSGSRSGSINMTRSSSGSTDAVAAPAPVETATPPPQLAQEPLPDAKRKFCKSMIELCLINPNDDELVSEIKIKFEPQYHAALITEILNVVLLKSAKDIQMVNKSLLYIVATKTVSIENFIKGLKEIFDFAPDLYIDVPMLYEYLGKLIALHIENKYVTFKQTLKLCEGVISGNQGNLFLKVLIKELQNSMGPSFVKIKWQESGLNLSDFMHEDQVSKWLEENKLEYLERDVNPIDRTEKILSPVETHSKLLQLMNAGETWDCIRGWIQDNVGKSTNEDWLMRALIQAICENATAGNANFSQDKMGKYVSLINEFGESTEVREASCLIGIQQLIHRLEHPKGLTLEIFQYLHEQYIISVEGFLAWEVSEKELEGKAVMKMALTSFFTSIKEADNDDSCSED